MRRLRALSFIAAMLLADPAASVCPLPTSGLVLHLESDAGVAASGGTITGWADQSGLANDLTAAGDPQLISAALNGQDYVEFDGAGDKLERTTTLSGFPVGAADRSMFQVVRYDSNGFGGTAYGDNACGQAFGLIVDNGGDLTVQRWCSDFQTSTPGNGAGWLRQSAIVDGSEVRHYKDGSLLQTDANNLATVSTRFVTGAEIDSNPYLDMDVAAVLLYDVALSEADRIAVENYLSEKYFGAACVIGSAPEADDDAALIASAGDSVLIDVVQGDVDADGSVDPTTVAVTSGPTNGTADPDPVTGEVTYQHDGSGALTDTFTYTVMDDQGNASNQATVRISVGPLPLDGLVLRLEGDAGVSENAGAVTTWADQSGNANDFTAAGDPSLIVTPDGVDAISLDGIDDRIERTGTLTGFPAANADRSVFAVLRYVDDQGVFVGFSYGNGAPNQAFGLVVNGTNGFLTVQGWGSGNDFPSGTAGVGAGWVRQAVVLANGVVRHFADGAQIDSDPHVYATSLTRAVIGEEINHLGFSVLDTAGALVYDRALVDEEVAFVDAYLAAKYFGDGDGVPGDVDVCPAIADPGQEDYDADGAGDACDLDDDDDGLSDVDEATAGTNPLDADSDDDGLSDGDEVGTYATDPLDADSDDDGVNDGVEVAAGSDPNDPGSVPAVPGAAAPALVLGLTTAAVLREVRRRRRS